MAQEQLGLGVWWVDAPCPRCGTVESLVVELSTRLVTPSDDVPQLELKARVSKTPHTCGQLSIRGALMEHEQHQM